MKATTAVMTVVVSVILTSVASAQLYSSPTVVATGATNETSTSATLRGRMTGDTSDCQVRFRYRKVSTSIWRETSWAGSVDQGEFFSRTVSSLASETQYEYQCQARYWVIGAGVDRGRSFWVTGNWSSSARFMTESTDPVAIPTGATNIQATSATLNGRLTEDTGKPCQTQFRYRRVGSSTWKDTNAKGSWREGQSFSETVGALTSNTRYEYQCRALALLSPGPGPIAVRRGDWSSSTYFTTGGTTGDHLYTVGRDGIHRISLTGNVEHLLALHKDSYDLEIRSDALYVTETARGGDIAVYSLEGNYIDSTPTPAAASAYVNFVALPGQRFALLDNANDKAFFIDEMGRLLATTVLLWPSDTRLQSLKGIVVGNRLILSENGKNQVLAVDLTTYRASIFKDLSYLPGALGDIAYADGRYYVVADRRFVYSFTESSGAVRVGEIPESNVTGICVIGDFAYVSVNLANRIYALDLRSGTARVLASGVNYPRDIECVQATGGGGCLADLIPYMNSVWTFTPRTLDLCTSSQGISFTYGVRNQGCSASGPYSVGFYASRDATITSSDYLLGSIPKNSFAPGESGTWITASFQIAAGELPSGTYYVGFIVDSRNQVQESLETNNVGMMPGSLTVVSCDSGGGSGPVICIGGVCFPLSPDPSAPNPSYTYIGSRPITVELNFRARLTAEVTPIPAIGGTWTAWLDPAEVGPGTVTTTLWVRAQNLNLAAFPGGITGVQVATVKIFGVPVF